MRSLNISEIHKVSGGLTDTQKSYLFTLGSLGITNLGVQAAFFAAGGAPIGAAGLAVTHLLVPVLNIAATAISYEASERFIAANKAAS